MALAASADVVVLAVGIDKSVECEGTDREDTALPGTQEPFVLKVLGLGKPTVLVMVNGGALAIDRVLDDAHSPNAIVEAYNPGPAGAEALAATLFGDANRWGRMVTTQYPHAFIAENPMTNYDMALPPGRTYRYYTGAPLFPFGFGLSYTALSLDCAPLGAPHPSGGLGYDCSVTNSGQREGDQVILVYHSVSQEIRTRVGTRHPVPLRALVGFERLTVAAGQTASAVVHVPLRALLVVNEDGERVLYRGVHNIIFSKGSGEDLVFSFPISDGL